jgi:hypothetical protein
MLSDYLAKITLNIYILGIPGIPNSPYAATYYQFYIVHSSISFRIFFSSPIYHITSLFSLTYSPVKGIYIILWGTFPFFTHIAPARTGWDNKPVLGLVLFSTSCHCQILNPDIPHTTVLISLFSISTLIYNISEQF